MFEVQGLRDKIVGKLTATSGEELEVSCNLTSNKQMDLFVEEMALTYLGSKYVTARADMLKRLTCSFQGRGRTDLVDIGKTPEFRVGGQNFEDL